MSASHRPGATRRRVAVAAGAVLLGFATGAAAKAPDAAGWWWRAQQAAAPVAAPVPLPAPPALPGPPNVEPGQLMVADAPDGPAAIAGVRFVLDEDETAPQLTLQEVDGANADMLVIDACYSLSRWSPADAGAWADRPEFDCGRARARGARAADGRWQFDLTEALDFGVVDVVLVPAAPEDGTPRRPGFVVFAKPDEAALETTPGPIAEPFSDPAPIPPEEVVAFDPVLGTPVDLGISEREAVDLVAARPRVVPPVAVAAPAGATSTAGRAGLAALIIFGACAAAASRLREERHVVLLDAPHLIEGANHGGDTEPALAGIGRFTRLRSGAAPPLT